MYSTNARSVGWEAADAVGSEVAWDMQNRTVVHIGRTDSFQTFYGLLLRNGPLRARRSARPGVGVASAVWRGWFIFMAGAVIYLQSRPTVILFRYTRLTALYFSRFTTK